MAEISGDINFNFGIEQIIDAVDTAPLNLPDTSGYVPGGGQIRPKLADTLLPPTVEQSVLNTFRPEIRQPEVCTPHGCGVIHNECLDFVNGKLSSLVTNNERSKVEKLISFLEGKKHLSDLLMRLRQLLQQA